MPQYTLAQSMRVFTFIWLGQLVSLLGSSLTGFALGVWVYQRTGSVTQYALISLFSLLPGLLIAPLAGVLVDRWDRLLVMLEQV
jgi:MFS transporter, DHA3 family, macrolide efflux protein